jgi:hypothetical protein
MPIINEAAKGIYRRGKPVPANANMIRLRLRFGSSSFLIWTSGRRDKYWIRHGSPMLGRRRRRIDRSYVAIDVALEPPQPMSCRTAV